MSSSDTLQQLHSRHSLMNNIDAGSQRDSPPLRCDSAPPFLPDGTLHNGCSLIPVEQKASALQLVLGDDSVDAWEPTAFLEGSCSWEWLLEAPRQALCRRIMALEGRLLEMIHHQESEAGATSVQSTPKPKSTKARFSVAASEKSQSIPSDLLCPISQELMLDPVVAADGFSYEREHISAWFDANDTSPMTGRRLATRLLIPNQVLATMIREFCQRVGIAFPDVDRSLGLYLRTPARETQGQGEQQNSQILHQLQQQPPLSADVRTSSTCAVM